MLVNRDVLKPFVWRNYSIVPGSRDTHWPGTCRATMWEAVRASSAAPGYFEEFKHDNNIHQVSLTKLDHFFRLVLSVDLMLNL